MAIVVSLSYSSIAIYLFWYCIYLGDYYFKNITSVVYLLTFELHMPYITQLCVSILLGVLISCICIILVNILQYIHLYGMKTHQYWSNYSVFRSTWVYGICVGILYYIFPLCLGNGMYAMQQIIYITYAIYERAQNSNNGSSSSGSIIDTITITNNSTHTNNSMNPNDLSAHSNYYYISVLTCTILAKLVCIWLSSMIIASPAVVSTNTSPCTANTSNNKDTHPILPSYVDNPINENNNTTDPGHNSTGVHSHQTVLTGGILFPVLSISIMIGSIFSICFPQVPVPYFLVSCGVAIPMGVFVIINMHTVNDPHQILSLSMIGIVLCMIFISIHATILVYITLMTCYISIHLFYDSIHPLDLVYSYNNEDITNKDEDEYTGNMEHKENGTHLLSPVTIAEITSTHRKLLLVIVILVIIKYITNCILAYAV